ncbi:MAG: hypothetical protein IPL47_06535 [Phyllobacteriaceae bacterium]|nr:hypothetical protein [Phyllobacteriaceae bacterium]
MTVSARGEIATALDRLEAAGFAMGPAWTTGHELAQAHEGETLFDRLHALLHRIEGDEWNAGYWYRRAGVPARDGPFADEAAALRSAIA